MTVHDRIAKEYGYDSLIEHGPILSYMASEDTELNIEPGSHQSLALVDYSGSHIPFLESSRLDIEPKTQTLFGEIKFVIPPSFPRTVVTDSLIMKYLMRNISKAYEDRTDIISCNYTHGLKVDNMTHLSSTNIEIYLVNDSHAVITLRTELQNDLTRGSKEDVFVFATELWTLTQSILASHGAQDSSISHSPFPIYVGATQQMQVSDLELAIETYFGTKQLYSPNSLSPKWDNGAVSKNLVKVCRRLVDVQAASDIAKALEYEVTKAYAIGSTETPTITEEAILRAIDRSRQSRRQLPDENNHRDSHTE